MKNYTGHNGTHNEELIDWLTADSGAKYVKTYGQFCALVTALSERGYATNPPPTEAGFNAGAQEFIAREAQRSSRRF